ncbi:protein mono-ADP-ribosyltransferase PARP14-like [Xiphophorus hellerii]|uniref:protein mono-ADP-ribosyltransferase PARP14-like n=1 Tax=Xiphophorus hellerii TaxID=8084 RepID=UPI0013B447B3|nr:protein mono-ADP-ribosyltransferase PARP14-like [Xiphophorus hellerii]
MYFPGQQAASEATPGTGYQVEVVQGAIEDQQDDAIVCPMIGHDPLSSRIGKTLSNIIGKQLKEKFDKETGKATLPGETVVVDGLPGLKCKAVIFLNLICWDNKEDGSAAQALRQGIKRILAICKIRGYSSVALPVLGTGVLLRFPHKIASTILLEEIGLYGQNRTEKTSFRVRVIVYPKDKQSSQAFKCAQGVLLQNGYISHVDLAEGSFYQCVSVIDDEITAMIGRVKLQLVCGDIVNAGTDVIVNTTNFTNLLTGVSKAILEAAGPAVHAELLQVGTPEDLICSTSAGQLGCKQIIHARFKGSTQRIRSTCKKILQHCESKGYGSVAFPAINTGQAGMLFGESCKAMLDGMAVAIKEMNPDFVSLIRIVILEKQVFQAFRSELESRCQQDDVQSWFSFLGFSKRPTKKILDMYLGRSRQDQTAELPEGAKWAIEDESGEFLELCLLDKEADVKRELSLDMSTKDGKRFTVNLKTREATECLTGKSYEMKNVATEPDSVASPLSLELPPQWEPMNGQQFKKVELDPKSTEYQNVADNFHKTTSYNIHKIERVQNVFLWHAFNICRRRILSKNGEADLGEKFLYHGTSAKSCDTIERDRFDRSYAGQHAAVFGKGVYFAVNAKYSATKYSLADESGLKRLYMARVITGRYTVGSSTMKAPPPRGTDPTDCFDSLVNCQVEPVIFVIFHDDQAYPEYLITFS